MTPSHSLELSTLADYGFNASVTFLTDFTASTEASQAIGDHSGTAVSIITDTSMLSISTICFWKYRWSYTRGAFHIVIKLIR